MNMLEKRLAAALTDEIMSSDLLGLCMEDN